MTIRAATRPPQWCWAGTVVEIDPNQHGNSRAHLEAQCPAPFERMADCGCMV